MFNMADTVRWGILGLGRIAESFAKGLSSVPEARLVACGSRSAEKAGEFGEKWNIPRCHASWEALAADPEVDAIYIATPHPLHFENAMLCLNAGKAVLCEKPFTMNAAEAETVMAAAERRGLLLMEAMWTRLLPHIRLAKELVEDGSLGELRTLHADFGFRCDGNVSGRLLNPELGGGALLDVGVYTASLANMLFGPPLEVKALSRIGKTGVDEDSSMIMRFENGAMASLSCSVMTATPQEAILSGDKGMLKISSPWWGPSSSLTLIRPGTPDEPLKTEVIGNGYNYEATEFCRCLSAGLLESPLMPHKDTLAVMRCLDEARRQVGLTYPMER